MKVNSVKVVPQISQTFDLRLSTLELGLWTSKYMFQHLINKGHKYGRKHITDFHFFDFHQANADSHNEKSSDSRHLRHNIWQQKLFQKRCRQGNETLIDKYPEDDNLRSAYALRLGLCLEVREGTIDTNRAIVIFDRYMNTLKWYAAELDRMQKEGEKEGV